MVFSTASTTNPYRLPTTINPIQYNLTLAPNFRNFTFTGYESISINISTDDLNINNAGNKPLSIDMHIGPDMKIANVSLIIVGYENNKHIKSTLQTYNNDTQIISLIFDVLLSQMASFRAAVLNINFSGILRDDMKGFYISSYNYLNTTIYNAVTQFESTDARRAFPCFDEPSFKSHFKITIIAPLITNVLSNMDVVHVEYALDTNKYQCEYNYVNTTNTKCKMVEFAPSPLMSPYLVSFAIGLYNNVTNYTSNGLKTSIYFPIDSDINHAKYALSAAVKILPYYESLFGVTFPLPKMDCLALSDFAAGAMENWGLVTYRRTALLVDVASSAQSALQRVVVVIAHEFAHQWFGNIVTMTWWNDLWLNEGFASFIEYIGTNYMDSSFQIWDFFLIYMNNVLITDSSYFTHAIESNVNDPNEIDTLFDRVTYDKGMSVIRMLYLFIGNETFMNGIHKYLLLHMYGNADTQQLWDALGGESITDMMNSWVLQKGFPYLNITTTVQNDAILFNVTQKRMLKANGVWFGLYDTELMHEYDNQIWQIPLSIKLIDGSINYENNIMRAVTDTMSVQRTRADGDKYEFYLFNSGMNGYFRVLYDEKAFDFILNAWLNTENKLSDFDKYALLCDRYAFMIANYISGAQYLQFIAKISVFESGNPQFLIWDIIINSLMTIDSLFCEKHLNDSKHIITNFRVYALNIISPVWVSINQWNITQNDSENVINLRALLIVAMVRFNEQNVIEYGYNLFVNNALDNNHKIAVNKQGEIEGIDANILRQVIECALTYQSENGESLNLLSEFIAIYNLLNSEYEQYLLRAIGSVYKSEDLNLRSLEFILSSTFVRDQDKLRGLYSLRRCYGREALWSYLIKNEFWDKLFHIYGSGFSAQDLTELPNTFASMNYYDNIYDFYYKEDGRKTSSNERSVNETLENIQINTEWIKNNYHDIAEYLFEANGLSNDNETSECSLLNYVWICILSLIVLLCLTVGFRWIWKKKLSKTKMFAYQRQIDDTDELDNDTTEAMIDKNDTNDYAVTINSIDDDQHDIDDDKL